MRFEYAVRCDVGLRRRNNEDNFYLDGQFLKLDEMDRGAALCGIKPCGAGAVCVFAVFDGMGGESHGELASLAAAAHLANMADELPMLDTAAARSGWLHRYVESANRVIRERGGEQRKRTGTTLALALLYNEKACIANIGDSRVYLLRGGRLRRLSRDHTLAAFLVERGDLSARKARRDPRRNALTKHLGQREIEPVPTPYEHPELELRPGDRLLLCSDGLTEMLPDRKITKLLKKAKSPDNAAEALLRAALDAGGRDNVTVLTVFCRD